MPRSGGTEETGRILDSMEGSCDSPASWQSEPPPHHQHRSHPQPQPKALRYSQIREVEEHHSMAHTLKHVGRLWAQDLAHSRWLPIVSWLRKYDRHQLFGDVVAGVTVSIMLIPQGLAYAALAGVAPVYGLYTSMIPLLVYTVFGTANRLSVGPAASTCIMISSAMASVQTSSKEEYTSLVFTMAFVGGVFQIIMGLFRGGAIAKLLSWPIKTGYMAGAALLIIGSQLQDSFGLTMHKDANFFIHVVRALIALPTTNWITALFTIGSLIILYGAQQIPKLPAWFPTPLLLMVIAVLVSVFADVTAHGVAVIGNVPQGFPTFIVPFRSFDDIITMIPGGITVAFVAYVSSISLGLSFAKDSREVDPNQELVAFGISYLIGSFTSSFAFSGAFSRAALNAQAGACTPASNGFAAICVLIVVLWLAPLVRWLPIAVLAAIIISAAGPLVKVKDFKTLWKSSPIDFWQCMLTVLVVLIWGLQVGIAAGVGASVLLLLLQSIFPRVHELGHLPQRPDIYLDATRTPDAVRNPQIRVIRIDSSLNFANCGSFCEQLRAILADAKPTSGAAPLLAVIVDCSRCVTIDATASQQIVSIVGAYKKAGVKLLFASSPSTMRRRLHKFGIDAANDEHGFFVTIHEAAASVHVVV